MPGATAKGNIADRPRHDVRRCLRRRPDGDRLHGIAKQIAHYANTAGVRQLDEHGEVRTVLPEGCVRGMPDPLPTENMSARFDLGSRGVEGVAMMAEPLRTELPAATPPAALHQKPVLTQSLPIRCGQAIGLGHRNGQSSRQIIAHLVAHSAASEPSRRLLTGVTIGPPITMATSLRLT
jgi:hypothetical protein